MHIESMEKMIECLATKADAQLAGNIENVDTQEMGDVVDMIKDLAEAKYYCTITKEMKEAKEEEETLAKNGVIPEMSRYYNDNRYSDGRYAPKYYDYGMGRRGYAMPYPDTYDPANEFYMNKGRLNKPYIYYYDGGSMSSGNGMSSSGGMSGNSGMRRYGTETYRPNRMNFTESGYDRAKRYYENSKMEHDSDSTEDKTANLQSLDEYLKELTSDITDMIGDASVEERTLLKNKLTTLIGKI